MDNFAQALGQKRKEFEEIAVEYFPDMVIHIKLQNQKLIKSKER